MKPHFALSFLFFLAFASPSFAGKKTPLDQCPVSAEEEPVCALAAGDCEQPPDDSSPVFRFDNREYFLRGEAGETREYLAGDEAFSHWTTLISTNRYPEISNPKNFAYALVQTAKEDCPNANGQVLENETAGTYIADFLLFSPADSTPRYAEWNLWLVKKHGKGIVALQYARRFYKLEISVADEIRSSREKLIPQLDILGNLPLLWKK